MDPDFPNNNNPYQASVPPQQTFQPQQPTGQDPRQSQAPPPADQNSYTPGGDFSSPDGDNKTKKLLIIIAALVGLFVIIAIIVLAFSSGDKDPNDQPEQQASGEFYVKEPAAVDVESVNNSISDNISGLDTNTDFPEDSLSDQNLGL